MPDLTGTPSDPGDDELDQLRALAGRVRPEAVAWETPPADLWDRIATGAELIDADHDAAAITADDPGADEPVAAAEVDAAVRAIGSDETSPPTADDGSTDQDGVASSVPPTLTPPIDAAAADSGAGAGAASVHPLETARAERARRRPARPWLVAIAAAVVLLLGAGAVVNRLSDPDTTVLASSPLERLAGDSGEGRAELLDRDGSLQLQVDTSGLDAGDGFLEVWVIDPDVTKLISLGPLRSDGRYQLPAGFDAKAFPIVDVSVEPIDGNPAHSGDSLLRGELRF